MFMFSPNFYQPSELLLPSIEEIRMKIAEAEQNLQEKRDILFDLSNGGGQQYGDALEQTVYRRYLIESIAQLELQLSEWNTQLDEWVAHRVSQVPASDTQRAMEEVEQALLQARIDREEVERRLDDPNNGGGQQYGDLIELANSRRHFTERLNYLNAQIRDLEIQSEYFASSNPSAQTTPGSLT
jgi:chromosome segregation ATPase